MRFAPESRLADVHAISDESQRALILAELAPRLPETEREAVLRDALATARALRALEPSRLAPGHGKIVHEPGAAMDAAIARAS